MPDMRQDVLREQQEQPVQDVCPRHIVRAVETDLKRAKAQAVPGQRIVRGTFILFEIEALLNAVKTMTTTVKITHEGPDHHDIEVVTANPSTGLVHGPAYRLSAGMSATIHVYDTQGIAIREIEKTAAVGGVGQVSVHTGG